MRTVLSALLIAVESQIHRGSAHSDSSHIWIVEFGGAGHVLANSIRFIISCALFQLSASVFHRPKVCNALTKGM